MKQLTLFLLIAIGLSSCLNQKNCLKRFPPEIVTKDSVIYRETVKDTTIYLPDDEAIATALVECDSFHQLIISELYDSLGRYTKASLQFKPQGVKYRVISKCDVDSAGIYFTWKERDTITSKTTTIKVPYPVPADLTWWEKFKVQYGGYALGGWSAALIILLLWGAWKIFKLTPYGAAVGGIGDLAGAGGALLSKLFKRG